MSKLKKNKQNSVGGPSISFNKPTFNPKNENLNFSLKDFEKSQKYGSGFKDWQKAGLLSVMMETLQGYCCRPLQEQLDGNKFTVYGDFPPKDKTRFSRPDYVSEDAEWARIHLMGKVVIVGHIVNNTFYIVFLDKSHNFWISQKKHT